MGNGNGGTRSTQKSHKKKGFGWRLFGEVVGALAFIATILALWQAHKANAEANYNDISDLLLEAETNLGGPNIESVLDPTPTPVGPANLEVAHENIQKVLNRQPQNVEANTLLAIYLIHREKFREAKDVLEEIGGFGHRTAAYPRTLNTLAVLRLTHPELYIEDTLQMLYEASESDPVYPAPLLNLGQYLRKEGRYEEALVVLEKGAELVPTSASVWTEVGTTRQLSKDLEGARSAFVRAQRLSKDELDCPNYNLGNILYELGDYEQAIEALREAVKRECGQEHAYPLLALSLIKQGQIPEARICLEECLEIVPSKKRARCHLVLAEHYEENDEETLAIQHRQAATRTAPRHTENWRALVGLLERQLERQELSTRSSVAEFER